MNHLIAALLLLLCIACSTDQNSLPKQIPVANENGEATATVESKMGTMDLAVFKNFQQQQASIANGMADGGFSEYVVRDGDGFVAESTTYYRDAEKTQAVKTKIIYLTGSFVDIYWLSNETLWVLQDDYIHVFQKGNLVLSLLDGEATEISDVDKAEVGKLPALATKILNSPASSDTE